MLVEKRPAVTAPYATTVTLYLGSRAGQEYASRAALIARELALKAGSVAKLIWHTPSSSDLVAITGTFYAGSSLPVAVTLLALTKCSRLRNETRAAAEAALTEACRDLQTEVPLEIPA